MSVQKKPIISIISSVYNVESYLSQSIESVLNQHFQDWELWLVDDGSTDRSGVICDEYAQRDSRIRVIHKENTGNSDSRNIALQQAEGEWIGFLDADDWIEPEMFTTLYEVALSHDADIAVCGFYWDFLDKVKPSLMPDRTTVYTSSEALQLILEDKLIKSYLWDKLYRKSILVDLLPKSFKYEDYRTVFKWFVRANRVVFTPVPFYHYRQRASSIVHVVNPCNEYHFFLAELERYAYINDHGLFPESKMDFQLKMVAVGSHSAKEIARSGGDYREIKGYIRHIREVIEPLAPPVIENLDSKQQLRLRRLFRSLWWYIFSLRIGGIFSLKRKKRNVKYYS